MDRKDKSPRRRGSLALVGPFARIRVIAALIVIAVAVAALVWRAATG